MQILETSEKITFTLKDACGGFSSSKFMAEFKRANLKYTVHRNVR